MGWYPCCCHRSPPPPPPPGPCQIYRDLRPQWIKGTATGIRNRRTGELVGNFEFVLEVPRFPRPLFICGVRGPLHIAWCPPPPEEEQTPPGDNYSGGGGYDAVLYECVFSWQEILTWPLLFQLVVAKICNSQAWDAVLSISVPPNTSWPDPPTIIWSGASYNVIIEDFSRLDLVLPALARCNDAIPLYWFDGQVSLESVDMPECVRDRTPCLKFLD